ncbi:cyclic nucleotide-binding protein [Gallibacterium genomosp. 2]|uniref:Cyclic nucleotide-binding protein n=1 Tax=Gallibacterium genomosp. 2 TaxID=155517 RepID=A0A0A2XMG7_9PAST|nr:DUF294 nucleotidyltransferase-like domain-containing protein [Gallibacterium genomosp. 2]KGQ33531.1 cyclic nucleotide-binding protein [Gallibacterium genomosp. 2]
MEASLLPNIVDFLTNIDPFDHLSTSDINLLASNIDILYLRKGQILEQQHLVGKGLFIIRSGAVEQRLFSGALKAKLADNDLFGFSLLYQEGNGDYQVTAIENTLLYRIPKQILLKLVDSNPTLKNHFASQESIRLSHSSNRIFTEENLYLKTVEEMMNRQIAIVAPNCSIQQTAQIMVKMHRSSALVMENEQLLGIISDRDITKRVVAKGISFHSPVSSVMTRQPKVIEKQAFLLEAIEMMMLHNVRSLPVVDNNNVIGILTATSLIERSRVQAVYLISRIYRQESIQDLISLAPQKQTIFLTLQRAGTNPQIVQQMLTLIADAFTKRLLQLAEKQLGTPPMKYAWIVVGSQARHEIHFNSDQDNGLILEHSPTKEDEEYFQKLSEFVCSGLADCGYPLCQGKVMANQPQWRVALSQWQTYYQQWILNPAPQSLLNINIFLDLRFLFGEEFLIEELKKTISTHIKGNQRFLAFLIANSLRTNPPLGLFKQFVLTKNGSNQKILNIKQQAINLIVELARVYALSVGDLTTDTEKRLEIAYQRGVISQTSKEELNQALIFLNNVRLRHQQYALQNKKTITNEIEPSSLTLFERNHLKDAFRIIARYQEAAQLRFNSKGLLR